MALSTKARSAKRPGKKVIYPVTPNGVEHRSILSGEMPKDLVIYPVTPNGVEHSVRKL